MFKIIGLIAGYYFAGVTGALLGFVTGWFVDRVRNYGVNQHAKLTRQPG